MGVDVAGAIAGGVAIGAAVVARCGVVVDAGIVVAALIGVAVATAAEVGAIADADVDVGGPSLRSVVVVAASVFKNFLGGGFGGGVASAFIFCRAFFASS